MAIDEGSTEEITASRLRSARRINRACDEFEAAWNAGDRRPIEAWLGEVPVDEVGLWLAELVPLEIELRRASGEAVERAVYLARFPDHEGVVGAAFDEPGETVVEPARRKATPPGRLEGSRFGNYELIEEIARGGMGVVYRARDLGLNRLVALKLMLAGRFASEAETARFLREAELAAALDHPNIVPIYEVGACHGQHFLCMKLIDGQGLGHHLDRFLSDPRFAARVVSAACRAIASAHEAGLLHRDIKPANILLDARGEPHVTDFGLATRFRADAAFTETGAVMGTPSYMPPEQARGTQKGELGVTVDVYGLGAVLYELLTGRPPFRAATQAETLMQVLEREPDAPRQVRPGVPRPLELICLKCLEKVPDRRYASARALGDDLDRYLRDEDVEARLTNPWIRLRRWGRREPELAVRLGTLAVVFALTQFNYKVTRTPDPVLHNVVTAYECAWASLGVLLQWRLRKGRDAYLTRLAWVGSDVVFLTLILLTLNMHHSSDAVGFPLLVAISGLWSRVRLVWWTTALCEVGYAVLLADAGLRGTLWGHDQHPNVVMASIAVTGAVVAHQVKRLRAISSYYEPAAVDPTFTAPGRKSPP